MNHYIEEFSNIEMNMDKKIQIFENIKTRIEKFIVELKNIASLNEEFGNIQNYYNSVLKKQKVKPSAMN
jgi:hypothetical protein